MYLKEIDYLNIYKLKNILKINRGSKENEDLEGMRRTVFKTEEEFESYKTHLNDMKLKSQNVLNALNWKGYDKSFLENVIKNTQFSSETLEDDSERITLFLENLKQLNLNVN